MAQTIIRVKGGKGMGAPGMKRREAKYSTSPFTAAGCGEVDVDNYWANIGLVRRIVALTKTRVQAQQSRTIIADKCQLVNNLGNRCLFADLLVEEPGDK